MKHLRTFAVMAVLAAALFMPRGFSSEAQANNMGGNVGGNGVRAYIYTVPVYYAAPGCQYTLYGTYFVTQYANGFEDWSEVNSVQNALSASGYWSQHGSGTFWRTIYN